MNDRIHKITLINRLTILKEILFRLEMRQITLEPNNNYLKNEILMLQWAIDELATKYNFIYDKIKVKGFVVRGKSDQEYLTALRALPRGYLEEQDCSSHGNSPFLHVKKGESKVCLDCLIQKLEQVLTFNENSRS